MTITSSQTGGFTSAPFLLRRRSRFVQSLAGLNRNSQSAIKPVIGQAKNEHRMDRNYLAGRDGDAINAVLAVVGYNFRRLMAWFSLLSSAIWFAFAAGLRQDPDAQTP